MTNPQLSDDMSDLMITDIAISTITSKTKFGENIYGNPIIIKGLVLKVIEQVTDKDNQKVDSNSKIFIDGNVVINESSKIEFNGLTPQIKSIKDLPNEDGIYAKIIYV